MNPTHNQLAAEHIEKMRRFFDAQPEPTASALGYRRLLAHHFNLMIPAGATVLEVGCGGGELLQLLRGARKVGIDVSEVQIRRARARLPDAEFYVQAG